MSKYLVTLKPLSSFFFGGERTFEFLNTDFEKQKFNIIKSNMFPQQTSILGMLRKEILIKNKLIKSDLKKYEPEEKAQISKLIGYGSFSINKHNDFKIIKKISPVFIGKVTKSNYEFLMRVPKDHDKKEEIFDINRYSSLKFKKDKVKCNYGINDHDYDDLTIPCGYDPKAGISNDFMNIANGVIVKCSDIFIKENNIGIKVKSKEEKAEDEKTEAKKSNDKSLFRIERYRLRSNFVYAFTVEIEDKDNEFENYNSIVSLGGESSYFSMNFEKVDFDIIDKIKFPFEENEAYKKMILVSDTYIEKDNNIYSKIPYAITSTVNFRNLRINEGKSDNYFKSFQKSSEKYSFLERGSVLFVKEDIRNIIRGLSNKELQKIGYNIFVY